MSRDKITNLIRYNWHFILIVFILLFFIIQSGYFAAEIKYGVPPDEVHHYSLSKEYEKADLVPENSPSTYRFGPVNDQPYLYYLLMGKSLYVNFTGLSDLLFLRIINIGFSLITLLFAYKTLSLFSKNKLIKVVYLIVFSNTLMFAFLSASVNYDNLLNMFSAGAIYYSLKFMKEDNITSLLSFIIFSGLALLTKYTYLPLGLVLGFFMLLELLRKRNYKIRLKKFKEEIISNKYKIFMLLIAVLILSSLTIELYILNIIKYHNYGPSCTQILTNEQCLNNAIYRRSKEFDLKLKPPANPIDPVEYSYYWSNLMEQRIFGILAHQNMPKPKKDLLPYNIFFILSIILWIRFFQLKKNDNRLFIYSFIAVLSYGAILAFYQNYQTYLVRGRIDIALQGRYIFPVLSLIYIFFLYPFDRYIKNKYLKLGVLFAIVVLFIYGSFIYFLQHDGASWYS